jgi:hypothetical protein
MEQRGKKIQTPRLSSGVAKDEGPSVNKKTRQGKSGKRSEKAIALAVFEKDLVPDPSIADLIRTRFHSLTKYQKFRFAQICTAARDAKIASNPEMSEELHDAGKAVAFAIKTDAEQRFTWPTSSALAKDLET